MKENQIRAHILLIELEGTSARSITRDNERERKKERCVHTLTDEECFL